MAMPMSDGLRKAFNDQIGLEFGAAYTYLGMAAYFDERNLIGFSNWMIRQYEEELLHARRFFDYMLDRDADIELPAIPAPRRDYASAADVFEASLENERKVTAAIHSLYRTASEEGDYSSVPLLQWFIDEQVEEEATVSRILDRVRMAGDDPGALLLLDAELGGRGEPGAGAGGSETGAA
jgi:ferritin